MVRGIQWFRGPGTDSEGFMNCVLNKYQSVGSSAVPTVFIRLDVVAPLLSHAAERSENSQAIATSSNNRTRDGVLDFQRDEFNMMNSYA